MSLPFPQSIDETVKFLEKADYITERSLATVLYLSLKLSRPLFLEGEAGVGKTEIAKVLAKLFDAPLIRLQCYEGLDIAHAIYEWNYARQMMAIRLMEAEGKSDGFANTIYSSDFLIERPVLQALRLNNGKRPILLIDELDRADEAFEAYLLEVLADNQVTIPEIGTIKAEEPPIVIITSNRTREVHDALKRRCLYHFVDYPDYETEKAILERKAPSASQDLAKAVVTFVQKLRQEDLFKKPGIAESLDWVKALVALDAGSLNPEIASDSLGVLLKYQDDIQKIQGEKLAALLDDKGAD